MDNKITVMVIDDCAHGYEDYSSVRLAILGRRWCKVHGESFFVHCQIVVRQHCRTCTCACTCTCTCACTCVDRRRVRDKLFMSHEKFITNSTPVNTGTSTSTSTSTTSKSSRSTSI